MSYIVPIRPAALPAWTALQGAIAENDYAVPCQGRPDVWTATDIDSVNYAERHCQQCPVMALCGAYADAAKERDAVWGGRWRGSKAVIRQEDVA